MVAGAELASVELASVLVQWERRTGSRRRAAGLGSAAIILAIS